MCVPHVSSQEKKNGTRGGARGFQGIGLYRYKLPRSNVQIPLRKCVSLIPFIR